MGLMVPVHPERWGPTRPLASLQRVIGFIEIEQLIASRSEDETTVGKLAPVPVFGTVSCVVPSLGFSRARLFSKNIIVS